MYTRIYCSFKGCDTLHYAYIINGEHRRLFHEYVWCDECDEAVANIDWVKHVSQHWVDIRTSVIHAVCAAHDDRPTPALRKYLSRVIDDDGVEEFDEFVSGFMKMTKSTTVDSETNVGGRGEVGTSLARS
jgi:hypothetical protein